jgi:hypothetical protein
LRVWETIKVSSYFWVKYPDLSFDNNPDRLDIAAVRAGWSDLMAHVELYRASSTITPIDEKNIIPF